MEPTVLGGYGKRVLELHPKAPIPRSIAPPPVLARTAEEIRACAGNTPTLSPNLGLLAAVREAGRKRLACVGTGCQVQTLRQAEHELGLDRLDRW
jgi:coenzyme F420-reducing hydrogenase beta subunit